VLAFFVFSFGEEEPSAGFSWVPISAFLTQASVEQKLKNICMSNIAHVLTSTPRSRGLPVPYSTGAILQSTHEAANARMCSRSEWLSPIPQFLQNFRCIYLFIYLFVCASVPLWRTVEFYLRWKSVWQVTFVRQSPCTPHFLPPPLNTTYELVLHIVQYNSLSLKKCVYNKNSYSQLSKWNDHWDCVAITSNNLQRHDL